MFRDDLPDSADVVIIGCGVVGCAIARELSKYDVRVVALEKEPDVGLWVSRMNMGVVHPFVPHKGKWKQWMCLEGNRRFDDLARKLAFPFKRPGLLIVSFSLLQSIALRIAYIYLKKIKKINCRLVGRKELRRMEPKISRKARSAIFVPTAGVVDPYLFTVALAENAVANGVDIVLEAEVKEIVKEEEGFLVKTNRGVIKARYIINAAGLASDIIESLVGIEERRMWHGKGVMIVFDVVGTDYYNHIIAPIPFRVDPRTKGGAMIIDPHGHAVWGPNLREAEGKDDESVAREDIETIIAKFGGVIEGFPKDKIAYYFAGVRPIDDTSWDFVLGSTGVKGFINAAYILSPGLTSSVVIAEKIVEFLKAEGLELRKKENFLDRREAILSLGDVIQEIMEKPEMAKKYANVLDPENMVSEYEVVESIRRGARTIDSVLGRLGLDREVSFDSDLLIRIIELLMENNREPRRNRIGTEIFVG